MEKRYLAALLAATFLFGALFPARKREVTQAGPFWTAALRFGCAAPSLRWRGAVRTGDRVCRV